MSIPNPVGVFDGHRLVRLHCDAGEKCNLDDAVNKERISWPEALDVLLATVWGEVVNVEGPTADAMVDLLCAHCFGGDL